MLTIYGKPKCPNCEKVKNVLAKKNIPFKYVDITQEEHASEKEFLISESHKSVPQAYEIDSATGKKTYIGDFLTLYSLYF